MPKVKKTGARQQTAPPNTSTTAAGNGGITVAGPGGPAGGTITSDGAIIKATTGTSDFKSLGWFTVSGDGCTVQFGIEQQKYELTATSPNYDAMFSMLLACWIDGRKVKLTYALPLLGGVSTEPSDAPLRIVSLLTL